MSARARAPNDGRKKWGHAAFALRVRRWSVAKLGCVASPARKFMGEERRQKRREEGVRETNLASDSYAGWSDFSPFHFLSISSK
jgi:hypothetical protein